MSKRFPVVQHPAKRVEKMDGDTDGYEVFLATESWVFGRVVAMRPEKVRYAGLNVVEMKDSKETNALVEKYVDKWFEENTDPEGYILLVCLGREKYGRLFARIQSIKDGVPNDLVTWMSQQLELQRYGGIEFVDPVLQSAEIGIDPQEVGA